MEALEHADTVLTSLVLLAELSTLTRCPYKDKEARCTAQFGCRNQRRDSEGTACTAADGDLNYQTAWATEPTS
jgi:hypothetical protein